MVTSNKYNEIHLCDPKSITGAFARWKILLTEKLTVQSLANLLWNGKPGGCDSKNFGNIMTMTSYPNDLAHEPLKVQTFNFLLKLTAIYPASFCEMRSSETADMMSMWSQSLTLWWNFQDWVNSIATLAPCHYSEVIMGMMASEITSTPDCLLNRLSKRRSKKISKLRMTGLWVGNSLVNYPHKGSETWKMVPFDDAIMHHQNISNHGNDYIG